MGYGVFWHLTPRLLRKFVDADRLRKRELEMQMYIQGRYVFDAVSLALANGFRQKGSQPLSWLEEPYRILPFTAEEEEQRTIEARKKAIEFFNSMIPKEKDGDNG